MQKQQEALQEVGSATHPTLLDADPLFAHNTGACNYRLLGGLCASMNRRVKRTAIRGNSLAAPRVRMAGSVAGSDTLYRKLSRTRERESCECQALQ